MSYLSKLLLKLESLKSDQQKSLVEKNTTSTKSPTNPAEKYSKVVSEDVSVSVSPNSVEHPSSKTVEEGMSPNSGECSKDASNAEACSESSDSRHLKASSCEVCTKAASKYTCPGCGLKTCSLPCVREHKTKLNCSGERIKTAFVDKSQYSDCDLLNDYRFLENAERAVYSNKIVPKNRHMGGQHFHHNHQHRMSPYHTHHSKRATILMAAARKRGVHLRMMPDHLEKHKSNTSFYTISSDVIVWHIEWQFVAANCLVKEEKVPESSVLMEAAKKYGNAVDYPHLRKALEDYRKTFHLCRYLIKVEGMPANRKRYIELYPSLTLAENLKGLSLVEHPTIFVLPASSPCDEFPLLNKDDDLTHMHVANMRHLTKNHPDYSQKEIIEDQILDPSSGVYQPDKNADDNDDAQVISDDSDS